MENTPSAYGVKSIMVSYFVIFEKFQNMKSIEDESQIFIVRFRLAIWWKAQNGGRYQIKALLFGTGFSSTGII